MSRKPEQRIADIIYCCEKILRFTSGMNQEQLAEQELVMDAILRNIEIIGEATTACLHTNCIQVASDVH